MLATCPRCDYPLKGLPASHACPECGLRYDEHSREWHAKIPWTTHLGLLGMVWGVVACVRIPFQQGGKIGFPWKILAWALAALMIGGFVWLVVHSVNLARRGVRAAATVDGVFMRLGAVKPTFIPWSNVSRVEPGPIRRGVQSVAVLLFLKQERSTMDIVGAFSRPADAEAFVTLARRYIESARHDQQVPAM